MRWDNLHNMEEYNAIIADVEKTVIRYIITEQDWEKVEEAVRTLRILNSMKKGGAFFEQWERIAQEQGKKDR